MVAKIKKPFINSARPFYQNTLQNKPTKVTKDQTTLKIFSFCPQK